MSNRILTGYTPQSYTGTTYTSFGQTLNPSSAQYPPWSSSQTPSGPTLSPSAQLYVPQNSGQRVIRYSNRNVSDTDPSTTEKRSASYRIVTNESSTSGISNSARPILTADSQPRTGLPSMGRQLGASGQPSYGFLSSKSAYSQPSTNDNYSLQANSSQTSEPSKFTLNVTPPPSQPTQSSLSGLSSTQIYQPVNSLKPPGSTVRDQRKSQTQYGIYGFESSGDSAYRHTPRRAGRPGKSCLKARSYSGGRNHVSFNNNPPLFLTFEPWMHKKEVQVISKPPSGALAVPIGTTRLERTSERIVHGNLEVPSTTQIRSGSVRRLDGKVF